MRLLVALLAAVLLVAAPVIGFTHEHERTDASCTGCKAASSEAATVRAGGGQLFLPLVLAVGRSEEAAPLGTSAQADPGAPRAPPA